MVDWNSLLAYNTVKVVKVRDWRLGTMHYIFQLCIFLYVVCYAVVLERGFMFKEQVVGGSVTLNSLPPFPGSAQKKNASELTYCCDEGDDTCIQNTSVLTCIYWDNLQAEYPPASNVEMAISSRVTVTQQTAPDGCSWSSWDESCEWTNGAAQDLFVANVESFTIRIRHGVHGQQVNKEGLSTGPHAMPGRLVDSNGDAVLRTWPDDNAPYPNQGAERSGDIISVAEFLTAVDLDIDTVTLDSDGNPTNARYDGINILVSINYEMTGVSGSGLQYTYIPRLLSDLEYKIEEPQIINGANEREILNRHAVRFIFVQTGELGSFDFTSLLITMVTALGLLAVANTLTNLMMANVLDMRDLYKWHTMEVSEDINAVAKMDPAAFKTKMDIVKHELKSGSGRFNSISSTRSKYKSSEQEPLLASDGSNA